MKLIAQGAEAKIYDTGNAILKKRIPKKYRNAELDEKLRTSRTKREVKIIKKLAEAKIHVPDILDIDLEESTLSIEKIQGKKLRDALNARNHETYAKALGKLITKVHNAHVIHGDLTTSNMILNTKKEIILIDFGLSFFSDKIEDKAVDIHLLRQALESKHNTIWEKAYKTFLQNYRPIQRKDILSRLEKVESRGRNKGKA